ncbi:type IV secretory system conjugative DNA transfer family protein [Plantibacter sp. Mn2098]|uniref:type IV secretory system conjugative DNA transfer family protein n=1 Tax=Plantibacter sp. Mn2098 TaxID=3395266 RepID=UPI003BCC137E
MGQQRQATTSPVAPLLLLGLVVLALAVPIVGIYGGSWISQDGQELPANPISAPFLLIGNRVAWSVASTIVAGGLVLVLLVVAVLVVVLRARRHGSKSRVDHKATLMGRGADIQQLSEQAAGKAAARFGVTGAVGVFIGVSVAGGRRLWADFESVVLQIWGPRQGKSSTQVIPAVVDAPGAVLTTSNKPDVIDATREIRAKVGTVWSFDPQQIAGDAPIWWWNPLSYVTDDSKAKTIAQLFAAAGRDPGAKRDPYFDPAGEDLIADLILAAAIAGKEIVDVYAWLQHGSPDEPLEILRGHRGGIFALNAGSLEEKFNMSGDQKSGVFGTATNMMQSLKHYGIRQWVNPMPNEQRPHFDVHAFVRSSDTLYVLSKEGEGSAAALTTALTVAVAAAAEEYAMQCKGRRLPVPLLMPLDEVANVCPWPDLPKKYSHYGSKGIIPIAFLQSWSQGVGLWGQEGMDMIWSAATVKVVGSGISEEGFLRKVANLIGEYVFDTVSESRGKAGTSRSFNKGGGKENIMTISDLQELPIGRVVVFRAGARTTLARTVPWQEGPHKAEILASLAIHEPDGSAPRVASTALTTPLRAPEQPRSRWADMGTTNRKDDA